MALAPKPGPAPYGAPEPGRCRFCGTHLRLSLVDLGATPLANAFLSAAALDAPEPHYPLHARVCTACFLVQIDAVVPPETIFSDYAYFSSFSASWLAHARAFAQRVTAHHGLGADSRVVEIASNDGYLLQYFRDFGVGVEGVEPAANVAAVARARGIPTKVAFFGRALAEEMIAEAPKPDLIIANNVLAHVPDLNDFVAGLKILLGHNGVLSFEVPHLLNLIEATQFDTIYHEHFSYFSLGTLELVLAAHGLMLSDVETLTTHGGSLRISARHVGSLHVPGQEVARVRARERSAGIERAATYQGFAGRVHALKRRLLDCLIELKDRGCTIVGYGAAAKGNTLLNYCGIGTDMIDYVVDANPHKQGLFLPGSRIPVLAPDRIAETRPDCILILPWNLKDEIMGQLGHTRSWGARFIVAAPEPEVIA